MINPIVFAGLLLMAATPAFAAPQCWFNGYQIQCDNPMSYPRFYDHREHRDHDRDRHEEHRERHEDRR